MCEHTCTCMCNITSSSFNVRMFLLITFNDYSQRPRLVTILSHGWEPEELTQQINTLVEHHHDDVLVLESDCGTSILSSGRFPWKRCSSATDRVYTYPDILQVSSSFIFCSYVVNLHDFVKNFRNRDSAYFSQGSGSAILTSQTCS